MKSEIPLNVRTLLWTDLIFAEAKTSNNFSDNRSGIDRLFELVRGVILTSNSTRIKYAILIRAFLGNAEYFFPARVSVTL